MSRGVGQSEPGEGTPDVGLKELVFPCVLGSAHRLC